MPLIWRSVLVSLAFLICPNMAIAAIDIYPIPDAISCNYFILPPIQGSQLSGNEAYYKSPSGTGHRYEPGDTIFTTTVLYAYDQMGVESDEECFYLRIIDELPDLGTIRDDTSCHFYVLPYFTTPAVSGFAGYYTGPQASGVRYQQGDTLFNSANLFVYDGYDNCFVEKEIHITIDTLPIFDDIPDQFGCNMYELIAFPGEHLIQDEIYFTHGSQTYNVGDTIFDNQTITIVATNGVCIAKSEFDVNIFDHLEIDPKQDTIICGNSFLLPEIYGPFVTSFARYYRLPGGQGTSYEADDSHNASAFPVLYIYDSIPGSSCVDETIWNIDYTPRPQAFRNFTVTVCRGYTYDIETLLLRRNTAQNENKIVPVEGNPMQPGETIFHTESNPPGPYFFYVIDSSGAPCIPDTAIMTVITTDDCTNPDFSETYCTDPNQENELYHLAANLEKDPAFCLGGRFIELTGNLFSRWDKQVFLDRRAPDTLQYYYILTDPSGISDTSLVTIKIQDNIVIERELIGSDTLCKGECTSIHISFLDDDAYQTLWSTESEEDPSIFEWFQIMESFTRNDVIHICYMNGKTNVFNENQDTVFLPFGNHTYLSYWWLSYLKECQSEDDTPFLITTLDEATFFFEETHCAGEEVVLFGETFSEERPEGEIKLDITSFNGCDSFIYVNLSFHTPAIAMFDQDVCANDTVIINCIAYTRDFPSDTQYLQGLGQFGCDSVIIVNLNFSPLETISIDTAICDGNIFHFAGLALDTPGITSGILQSVNLCDSLAYTINLSINPIPIVEIKLETPLCDGNAGSISVPGNYAEVMWSTSATSYQIDILQSGEYIVTVTDENSCTQTASIFVNPSDEFNISGPHQYTTEPDQPVQIELLALGELDSISWLNPAGLDCENCLNPVATVSSSTTFSYIAFDQNGCTVSGTITILVEEHIARYIPNIFYPFSEIPDNRVFNISTDPPLKTYSLTIYDRWGNMLFRKDDLHTNDTSGAWNGSSKGKQVQSGVYVYRIIMEGSQEPITGTVTVIN